jgi:hypothetical protein
MRRNKTEGSGESSSLDNGKMAAENQASLVRAIGGFSSLGAHILLLLRNMPGTHTLGLIGSRKPNF